MKVLLLDNYDSFTYNLSHLIESFQPKVELHVVKNDQISLHEIEYFDKILLSPGPGLPKDAGIMPELIKQFSHSKDIFGVCLGLQAIAEAFGGKLENLPIVFHGLSTSIQIIEHDIIYKNCPNSFQVGRYHSWVVSKNHLPDSFVITSIDKGNLIMSLKHKTLKIRGVQFHPESIMTEFGKNMIENWLLEE